MINLLCLPGITLLTLWCQRCGTSLVIKENEYFNATAAGCLQSAPQFPARACLFHPPSCVLPQYIPLAAPPAAYFLAGRHNRYLAQLFITPLPCLPTECTTAFSERSHTNHCALGEKPTRYCISNPREQETMHSKEVHRMGN